MYFLLHHSKGTLVLAADDSEQVIEWSKRQLGRQVSFVSNIDSQQAAMDSLVERSGTGQKAASLMGCHPLISITAEIDHGLTVRQENVDCYSNSMIEGRKFAREPIWH